MVINQNTEGEATDIESGQVRNGCIGTQQPARRLHMRLLPFQLGHSGERRLTSLLTRSAQASRRFPVFSGKCLEGSTKYVLTGTHVVSCIHCWGKCRWAAAAILLPKRACEQPEPHDFHTAAIIQSHLPQREMADVRDSASGDAIFERASRFLNR